MELEVCGDDVPGVFVEGVEPGVLSVVKHNKSSFPYRLTFDSCLLDMKSAICRHWIDLSPLMFDMYFNRDDKCYYISNDDDLQSLAFICFKRKQIFVEVIIDIKKMSMGICRSDVLASSSSDSSCVLNYEIMSKPSLKSSTWLNVFKGVGQVFLGGAVEVRNKLRQYSIESYKKYVLKKNNAKRVKAICKNAIEENCGWKIVVVSYSASGGAMEMKEMEMKHSCGFACKDYNNPCVSSNLVKSLILDEVRDEVSIKPKNIISRFKREYGIVLKYYYAYTGKELAIKEIYGDVGYSFHHLLWYKQAILQTNPGSYVVLEVDHVTKKFQRIFVAFEASIHGFKHCRPMLCLDGTFLKTKYKGCLMSASAKNGNQGFFTLAIAVDDTENDSNWFWFLSNLKAIVSMDRVITFISDRHCSLLKNVSLVFLTCYHAFCLWHLKNNLAHAAGRYASTDTLKKLLARCAYASNHNEYMENLRHLLSFGGAKVAKFMEGIPPERWANAYFPGNRYGELCSNIAESFNKWIIEERSMPIVAMLDRIRSRMMKMMSDRRDDSMKWTTILCPTMEDILAEKYEEARTLTVIKSSDFIYEVESSRKHDVDLMRRVCSCRKWHIHGFPCKHAVAAIVAKGDLVYDYFETYFYSRSFRNTYSHAVQPIPTEDKPPDFVEEPQILPPDVKRPPGRPKTKRKTNLGSKKLLKAQKCSSCNTTGHHNRRTCPSLYD